ncbi:DNA cytosine methyltransferase [Nicoletella semolina]|nr:DNA cytosine methyltransferase [Nicoletella semolina]
MDFCSGIGAGRLGLELCAMKCVGHSEIDPIADLTYQLFFGDKGNLGDLSQLNIPALPDFDLMLAGFPCQTFSIAGKRTGFNDDRGQIIYHLVDILTWKNVPYFLLENVKGIVNHNNGKTLNVILSLLDNAGYDVSFEVLDSQFYGVPQMRERAYFVGIRKDIKHKPYQFPQRKDGLGKEQDIQFYLNDKRDYEFDIYSPTFQKYLNNKYNQGKYDLTSFLEKDYTIIDWRQSDFRVYDRKSPTLRTGRHGILYTKNGKLRKLSGYEALRLQGFPKDIAEKVIEHNLPDSRVLAQAGNAMTVTVIQKLAQQLLKALEV